MFYKSTNLSDILLITQNNEIFFFVDVIILFHYAAQKYFFLCGVNNFYPCSSLPRRQAGAPSVLFVLLVLLVLNLSKYLCSLFFNYLSVVIRTIRPAFGGIRVQMSSVFFYLNDSNVFCNPNVAETGILSIPKAFLILRFETRYDSILLLMFI